MKIGLIADTHMYPSSKGLPHQVADIFEGVDLILHAGDLIVMPVLSWLEEIAPVLAVRGNGDSRLPADPRIPDMRVIAAENKRIGLLHVLDPRADVQQSMERFFGEKVDIIVFGDSHVAVIENKDGVLLINPGSPVLPRGTVGVTGTVALLDIIDGEAKARIINLS